MGTLGYLGDIRVSGAQEEVESGDVNTGILSTLIILGLWERTELLRE